ncbi:MAG: hypothetical protein ACI9FN_000951 [Saprospiraceae bacterium]
MYTYWLFIYVYKMSFYIRDEYTYDFRLDEFKNRNFPTTKQLGFIAQNVETVVPEVVRTNADGYKAVDYSKITALLNEAIKEQQIQIEEQAELIKSQQSLVRALLAILKQWLKK